MDITHLQDFLKALAGETRQRIMFSFHDERERTVSEVADAVGIAQPTASQHLAALRAGWTRAVQTRVKDGSIHPRPRQNPACAERAAHVLVAMLSR